jgi:hypothetical protein
MSLVFGGGTEPNVIGALSVTRSFANTKRCGTAVPSLARLISFARDFSGQTAALLSDERSGLVSLHPVMSNEETSIRDEFSCIAAVVGLSDADRATLLGANPELSRVILALETVAAALELFGAPEAAVAWLHAEGPDEPFNQRSPLQAMADDGRLGVEIALLHLRARLRVAPFSREWIGSARAGVGDQHQ